MTNKEYRERIHDLIPGGAHTYSKGDDQFPGNAPAAISHGKGAWVWDLEGNRYLDCSMGLTSVSLGHAHERILNEVKAEMAKGVNFQRPSYIELEMAEKFLSLVPSHDMIKFAKNGSTVTTAAIKLARAYTGRDLVAFPGDHPFYSYDDWFIGKTATNRGVPEDIQKLSVTFKSCDLESLKDLFEAHPGQIAAVITEPEKPHCGVNCNCEKPVSQFLKEAIDLAHEHGALFIVDEMVTGFKTALPGSFTKFGLEPDLATWGKGIANGFSFCAMSGKKEIMEIGGIRREGEEKVFLISTTHGAETHTLRAGIATIDEFLSEQVIDHMHSTCSGLRTDLLEMIRHHGLTEHIEIQGEQWMLLFIFKNQNLEVDPALRTYFLQSMFEESVLFQGAFVPSFSHSEEETSFFKSAFEKSLLKFKEVLQSDVEKLLQGPVIKPVFRKYV
jgi:glutamate-1-semialdehyde 2,1-aminomutase